MLCDSGSLQFRWSAGGVEPIQISSFDCCSRLGMLYLSFAAWELARILATTSSVMHLATILSVVSAVDSNSGAWF